MLDVLPEPQLAALFGAIGGLFLGLAARLGRFCTMGAIEDALYGGSLVRLRMWGIAIGTAVIGSFILVGMDLLEPARTIYHSEPWNPLASIFGGLLFGYGMAMAGNCGFGALARLGGGDLRSFVIVLVMGIAAFATLSGPLARARVALTDSYALNMDPNGFAGWLAHGLNSPVWLCGLVLGALILVASAASGELRKAPRAIGWGVVVGLAVTSGWIGTYWLANHGFDAMPVVSHTFSSPLGNSILYVMTSSGGGLNFGVGSVAGVIAGSFLGSLIKGHFRWEACEDPRELRRQILGAAAMGIGAVTAFGCTIGQGISAFSVLAVSAPVTLGAIFLGASIGLRQLITGFGLNRIS